jgi:hypothetical protein
MGVFQVGWNLWGTLICAELPNAKLHVATAAMVPAIIGTILINNLPTSNHRGRAVGMWLIPSYPTAFLVVVGLLSTNIVGTTKRTVANGMVFVGYCVGQMGGQYPVNSTSNFLEVFAHADKYERPQFVKASEKPAYPSGVKGMLFAFVFNLVFAQVLRFLYVMENKKRNKTLQGRVRKKWREWMKRET